MISSRDLLPIIGFLLLILLTALLYPGMLNMDSAGMLAQAVAGRFNDWHSPAVSLLWRQLIQLYPGPASLLTLGLALFIAGSCWFARGATANPAAQIFVVLLLCLWPPMLNDLSLVGKDQAFIACLMPAIALSLHVTKTGRLTPPMMALAAALLFALCAIRQDSAICLIPALALLYRLPWGGRARGFGWRMASGLAIVSVIAGLGLAAAFNRLAARAAITFPIQTTLVHDLAGISAKTGLYLMPPYVDPALDLPMLKARYTPVSGDPLLFDMHNPIVKLIFDASEAEQLKQSWEKAVLSHPWFYLQHRFATLMHLLGIETPQPYQLYQPDTDLFAAHWHKLTDDMHIENPDNAVLGFYRHEIMPALLETPVFRGYAYDIVLFVLIVLALIRRRGWRDTAIVALGGGALLHQAALLLASPAALFRYLYPSVSISLVVLILTLARDRKGPAPEMSLGAREASG